MASTRIIAVDPRIVAPVEHGRVVDGSVTVVAAGGTPVAGIGKVTDVALPKGVPVGVATLVITAVVAAETGDVVLATSKPAEWILVGTVVVKLNAVSPPDLKSVRAGTTELSRYGGPSSESVTFDSPAVMVLSGGAEAEGELVSAEVTEGSAYDAKVTGQEKTEVVTVNLGVAKRVISAGHGFKAKEDLKLAEELAATIGTELACSRPPAEGADRMAIDRYIGVSGQITSSELYIAVGVSGQTQRTMGMSGSKVVVAVSSDSKAFIFVGADYGTVGDLYEALLALMKTARQESWPEKITIPTLSSSAEE